MQPDDGNDPQTLLKTQHFPLSRWLHQHGVELEDQLLIVQWALPMLLSVIVFMDEFREHILGKGEPLTTEPFIAEIVFFGVLGPIAVWLVLFWVRAEWRQRERDRQMLQQTYDELAAAQERLRALHAQRGELLNRIMLVQEEERRRVAREIHDELGQLLTGLSLNLSVCREAIPDSYPEVRSHMARINVLVTQTIDQMHHIILDIRPISLDDYGLLPALREELDKRLTPLGIEASIEANGDLERLDADTATTAFRVIQEAITNVIRHAHARHVAMRLELTEGDFLATVEDDGVGLDAGSEPGGKRDDDYQGMGILGMQERAAALGGTVTVTARQPQGVRVSISLPTRPTAAAPVAPSPAQQHAPQSPMQRASAQRPKASLSTSGQGAARP